MSAQDRTLSDPDWSVGAIDVTLRRVNPAQPCEPAARGDGRPAAPQAKPSSSLPSVNVPCYSARFVPPFAEVLSTYECVPPEAIAKLRAIDPASRISATVANDLAVHQVAITGDPDLGLKAARRMPLGRAGPLDYAMHSAATVRESAAVARRYIRAYSDVLNIRLDGEDTRVVVRLEVGVPAPRPILDFMMSAWYANHIRPLLAGARGLECRFSHQRPANMTEYERAFEGAALQFGAPSYGFAFEGEYLEAPLPCADAAIHVVLCEHVQRTLEQSIGQPTLSSQVREVASRDLREGTPKLFTVAHQLRLRPRTLARRLAREGTTFSAILDGVRQELGQGFVIGDELSLTEIAFRLGFSHVEAFYRAFRRWTGRTPLTYRHEHAVSGAAVIVTS
jgi:AraC-like DNA-binding protein